jgi:hypothetical protein
MLGFLFLHEDTVPAIGTVCFGLVIGWYAWFNVRRTTSPSITDIASFAGAIGGAAVIKLFPDLLFGYYCIGLAVGFFACVTVVGLHLIDPKS